MTGSLIQSGVKFEDAFAGVSKTVDGVALGFKELATDMYGTSQGLSQVQKDAVFANEAFGDLTATGKEIRQEFRDMSLQIPIAATELARTGQVAGQLGVHASQITEFTETMALLGVTTDLSSEQAAFAVARFGNIMGVTDTEISNFAKHMGSTLVALGNSAAATEPEIVNIGLRLAAAGRLAGLTSQEILGLSTTLAEMGVRQELGGTAMSRVLQEMILAIADGGSELTTFANIAGMSAEQFTAAFKGDPINTLKLFIERLAQMQEAGEVNKDMLIEMGLSGVRVRDVLGRLGPNMEAVTNNIDLANVAWAEQIALQEEATKRFKTIQSQMQLLKNSFVDLGITVFDIVRDDIARFISVVRNLIDRFKELEPETLRLILRIGLIAAAIGPALIAFGTLIQLTSIAIGGFATLGNLFKTFIALPLSPFGIIGTFLFGKKNDGVRTGGLLSKFNLKGLAGSAQSVLGSVLGIFNLKGGIIAQLARPLTSGIQAVFRTAFGFLSKGVGVGVGLGGQLVSFLSNFLLTGVKTVISSIASMFLGPGAGFLTSSLFGIINVPITMLKTALRSAASLVGPFASVVVGAIKLPFGLLGDMIGGLLHSIPVLGGFIGKFLIGTLGKLPLILTGVGVALTAIFAPKVISQAVKNWNAVLQQLKLGFTSFVRDVKDEGLEKAILLFTSGGSTGSGRLGGIFGIAVALGASVDHARQFSYAIGTASYWVIQIVKGFFNVISSLKYVVSGTKRVEDATGGTATRLISFAEFLAKLFEGIYHGLMNTFHLFSAGMENLVDGVRAALSGIGKLFDVIFGKAEDDIQDTYAALAVGTDSPALSLGEKIGEIINTIIYFVTTGLGAIGQLVGAIATFFADIIAAYKEKGVRGVLEEIGEKAKSIWNGIVTKLRDLWDRAKPHLETFLTNAVNWLISTGAPAVASAAVSLATGITSAFKTALFGSNKEVQVGTRAIQNTLASNRKEFFIPLTGGIPQEALDTILSIGEQNFTFEPVYEQDTGIIGQIRTLVSDIKAVLTSEETKTQISEGFSNAWNSLTTWIETEAWPETEPTLRDWVNQIIDWFNNTALPKFKEIGSSIGEWLLDGLKSSVADIITPDFLGELKKGQFGDATVDFLRFIIGYKTSDKIVKPLLEGLADSFTGAGRTSGDNFMSGLNNYIAGMSLPPEQAAKVTAVGALIADLLDGKFKERLGISSPSRVMAQHGADIIQGLINGLYNSMGGLSNVISRITYMFDTLRFGITNNLSGALSALSNFGMQASALINNATSVISNGINSVANMISNLTNTVKTMPSTVNSGGLSLLPGSGMTVTYVPQPVTSGVTNITTSYTYSPTFASTPDRATRDANTTLYNVWKYSPKAVG